MIRICLVALAILGCSAWVSQAHSDSSLTTADARSVSRYAVSGIAYDLGAQNDEDVSIFDCHLARTRAACSVQVYGAWQILRARILIFERSGDIRWAVKRARFVPLPPDRFSPGAFIVTSASP
jgi:hypothetical protein